MRKGPPRPPSSLGEKEYTFALTSKPRVHALSRVSKEFWPIAQETARFVWSRLHRQRSGLKTRCKYRLVSDSAPRSHMACIWYIMVLLVRAEQVLLRSSEATSISSAVSTLDPSGSSTSADSGSASSSVFRMRRPLAALVAASAQICSAMICSSSTGKAPKPRIMFTRSFPTLLINPQ